MPTTTDTIKHVVAGGGAMRTMSRLLGLGQAAGGWRLEALCLLGPESMRVGLRKGKTSLVFYIVKKAGKFSLSAEGTPGPAVNRFLDAIAKRLAGRTFADLVALLEKDPESLVEDAPNGSSAPGLSVPLAAGPINLMEAGWRNFFADQDFEVVLGYPELSMDGVVYARYSDRDCLYSWSGNDPRKWSFFAYPVRVPSESFGAAVFRKGIIMELEEKDVVLGTVEKADSLVNAVIEKANAPGSDARFVVFNHFCTATVMGEDIGSVANRVESATGRPAVSWTHGDRDQLNNFGEYFRKLFARPGFFDAPADSGAVNLFHFPTDFREAELVPLLKKLGVRVNMSLFPDVHFPSIEKLPGAAAHIFCEATSYQSRLKEFLEKHKQPVKTVRAPYGLAGTEECLKDIAAAAGRGKAFARAWKGWLRELRPEWEKMREEARRYRLAFVVSETTLPRLWKIRHGLGAPLMPMIEEMGFGVDILYFAPHAERPDLPQNSRCAALSTFRTPSELEALLRGGKFNAVYSDIFFDWRISSAGKARFSSKDFEMGLGGALRSLKRLLAVCRMPFYSRYGAHLERVKRPHA